MDVIAQPPSPWFVDAARFPHVGTEADRLRFLIRYALLAPSTRNTQPWRFRVLDGAVEAFIDLERWQRVADPDQREMHISIGCALENLAIAGAHFGYRTALDYLASGDHPTLVARLRFVPGDVPSPAVGDPRFAAITARHTHHGVYEPRPLSDEDRAALRGIAVDPGLRLDWIDDAAGAAAVDEIMLRADAALLSRPEYREELADVIGSGAFGTPWLLATAARFAVAHLVPTRRMTDMDRRALASAAEIGVISARADSREAQIRVGQVLERLYLEATLRGIALQPVSQPLETAETAAALAALLPEAGWQPLQPFRVGYAREPRVHTPRRPLDEVVD